MVTASFGHYGQRAARIGPDSICWIRLLASFLAFFFFFFLKKAGIILCRTDPDPIWTVWSGFGQTHLARKQAGVQESSGPVSGRTQPARYHFPTFRLGSALPQTSRTILCKNQSGSDLVLADCAMFWPNGSSPDRKQAGVQESSGQKLANASDPIRTGCESDPACLVGRTQLRTTRPSTRTLKRAS